MRLINSMHLVSHFAKVTGLQTTDIIDSMSLVTKVDYF